MKLPDKGVSFNNNGRESSTLFGTIESGGGEIGGFTDSESRSSEKVGRLISSTLFRLDGWITIRRSRKESRVAVESDWRREAFETVFKGT
jgi:hypothetical protein